MTRDVLRIMVYRHSVFYSPLITTIAGGFLKEEGIDAEYFPKPAHRNLYEMFRSGEVDIMQAAVSTSWEPLSKGIKDLPVHFAQINQRDGFFITSTPARAGRGFQWNDLEGAKLIADHAQQPFAMLKFGLHRAGVDIDKVELVNAGGPAKMAEAFRSGAGDYVHLQGPAPQQLERDGLGRVVAAVGEIVPPVAFSSLMALREFLVTPPAAAFMRAFTRAARFVIQSPAREIAELEAVYFPEYSVDAISEAVSRYQQLGTWRSDPTITREQYEMAMDVFVFANVFTERYVFEDVVASFSWH